MREAEARFLAESFKKYYFAHFDMVDMPESAARREFGYQRFGSGMVRHLRFLDEKQLRVSIVQNSPSDVYCSNGYYSFPDLPMNQKAWQGADLIFDIDAKDLNLSCRPNHTVRRCGQCERAYLGEKQCPHCNSERHDEKSLTCVKCINAAKDEVRKLVRILAEDIGIKHESILTYFSGNEGFHMHVDAPQLRKLESKQRRDLAEYLMFSGVIPERYGMRKSGAKRVDFPEFGEKGWRGRLAAALYGSKSARSKAITATMNDGRDAFASRLREIGLEIGARIDPAVTMDIHRIFRLAGSLNGKSGLAKMPASDLEEFKPYTDACLIDSDEVRIKADVPVRFELGGKKFGPYAAETLSVPRFAAVYMICKGLAAAA